MASLQRAGLEVAELVVPDGSDFHFRCFVSPSAEQRKLIKSYANKYLRDAGWSGILRFQRANPRAFVISLEKSSSSFMKKL